MRNFLFTITITLIFVGAGCSQMASQDQTDFSEDNLHDVPSFALQDYQGDIVTLESLKGTPLILNSWASWCPFCRKELLDFAKVQQERIGEVKFVAINRGESYTKARQFTDQSGMSSSLLFLTDYEDSFYQSIGGFSMPETLFVNSLGQIIEHKRGPISLEELRQKIDELIATSLVE